MSELQAGGPTSRAELAVKTGLSVPTVSKLTAKLLQLGIVVEGGSESRPQRSSGRPAIPISFSAWSRVGVGIHVNHHRLVAVAVDLHGKVRARLQTERDLEKATNWVDLAVQQLVSMLPTTPGPAMVVGVGVCSEGELAAEVECRRSADGRSYHQLTHDGAMIADVPVVIDNGVCGLIAMYRQREGIGSSRSVLHVVVGSEGRWVFDAGRQSHGRNRGCRVGTFPDWPTTSPLDETAPNVADSGRSCGEAASGPPGMTAAAWADLLPEDSFSSPASTVFFRERVQAIAQSISAAADLTAPETILVSGTATRWPTFAGELDQALRSSGTRSWSHLVTIIPEPADGAETAAALLLEDYFADPASYEPGLNSGVDRMC